jgi:hypothetical protein
MDKFYYVAWEVRENQTIQQLGTGQGYIGLNHTQALALDCNNPAYVEEIPSAAPFLAGVVIYKNKALNAVKNSGIVLGH